MLLLFSSLASFSLGTRILHKADIGKLPEATKFAFIEPSSDSTGFQYVALIEGNDLIRKSNIENLYFEIRKRANKLGANCFRLKSFTPDNGNGEVILILETFYATDSVLQINKYNHEKNVVFIFGDEKEEGKPFSFTINKELKEIKSGRFYKIELTESDEFFINKGGVTGTTLYLKFEEANQPMFYTLSGFGASYQQFMQSSGIAFKTGGINRIENVSLGLLITQILKQTE